MSAEPTQSNALHYDTVLFFLKAPKIEPMELTRSSGWCQHPAVPWDLLDEYPVAPFFRAWGYDFAFNHMQYELDEEHPVMVGYMERGLGSCEGWEPAAPLGDGWILIAILDTDEGPCAWSVRRTPGRVLAPATLPPPVSTGDNALPAGVPATMRQLTDMVGQWRKEAAEFRDDPIMAGSCEMLSECAAELEAALATVEKAISAHTAAAAQEAVAKERAEIRSKAHDRMFPFRMSANWTHNSSETIADVLLGTYIPTERGESA